MPGGGRRVAVYKRGNVWWYEFTFEGRRIQESAGTGSRETALRRESVHKLRIIRESEYQTLKSDLRIMIRCPRFDQALLEIMEEQEQEMES